MKIELESQCDQRQAMQAAAHGDQGVFFTGGFLSRAQPILVALLIFELEPIDGFNISEESLRHRAHPGSCPRRFRAPIRM